MTGIVPPGQGHLLTARGNVMAFKAVAEQTGGDFSLMERTVPPGASPSFRDKLILVFFSLVSDGAGVGLMYYPCQRLGA